MAQHNWEWGTTQQISFQLDMHMAVNEELKMDVILESANKTNENEFTLTFVSLR